jgi:hypothetical protein
MEGVEGNEGNGELVRQSDERARDQEKLSIKATTGGVWRIQRGQQGGRERRLNV